MIPRRWSLQKGRRHKMALLKSPRIGIFCEERGKKPIALGVRKFRYRGPGTRWQEFARMRWRERPFPIQTGDSAELNQLYKFGANRGALSKANLNIIRCLSNSGRYSTLEEAVH